MPVLARLIDRPVAAILLAVGIVLGGIAAYRQLAVAMLPAIDLPTILVHASLPGASPETMASTVAMPIERRLGKISGVRELTSWNTPGLSRVAVQFELTRNLDGAAVDVQAALNAAMGELPRDMPDAPRLIKINPALAPIMFIAVKSETMPLENVFRLAESVIAQRLSQVQGVGRVEIQGAERAAVRVRLDSGAIGAIGLGLDDVRAAIAAATAHGPKGVLEDAARASTVVANTQLEGAEAFGAIVVAMRNGAPVRLESIATITDGVADSKVVGWYDDRPAICLFIQREPGANAVETARRVREALPQLARWLPPAVSIEVIADRTDIIQGAIADAQRTLALTVAFVLLLLFLFLGDMRAALISSITIPVSLAGTAIVMFLLGYTLDMISLAALAVSVGFIVDDAIVVVENIARHRESGETARAASLSGTAQIAFTVVSITASLVAAFIPVLVVTGVIGPFMREFSVTLCTAVAFSCLVSLTLTPILSAKFLSAGPSRTAPLAQVTERVWGVLLGLHERLLRLVLRHPRLTLGTTIMSGLVTLGLYAVVPKGFLPAQDTGFALGVVEGPQDISFPAMRDRLREVSRLAQQDPNVRHVIAYIGSGGLMGPIGAGYGRLYIIFKPRETRGVSMAEAMEQLRLRLSGIPGISTYVLPIEDIQVGAREGRGQYQFTLQDEDWAQLERWLPGVVKRLSGLPELRDVATDHRNRGLSATVDIDRDRAAQFGVSPRRITDSLYDAFGQRRIATLYRPTDQVHVVIEADAAEDAGLDALRDIHIKAADGGELPLSAVTRVVPGTASVFIAHQDQFPAITITFNLAPGVVLGDAIASIQGAMSGMHVPATLRASFEGTAGAFVVTSVVHPFLILAAFAVIYMVLGVLYESFVHPLTILATLPSAGLGGLLALYLLGVEVTAVTFVGIVLLIGIAKKNAIMMIDFALTAERKRNLDAGEAIYEACMARFRPILLTTLTAIVGLLPLVFGEGPGSELRRPLGIVIAGGLAMSQFVTVYATPVIYVYLDRLRRRDRGPRHPATHVKAAP